ncbi:MAG: YceI family protein [Vampirovibrionales bacterium]
MPGSFIHFRMVHRKLGGHVIQHRWRGQGVLCYGGIWKKKSYAALSFRVQDDTDNGTRDHKMTTDSLKSSSHPMIRVIFNKPLNLGSQTVPGTMEILGNKKPVTLPITIKKTGTTYQASGKATVTFSGLGFPSPVLFRMPLLRWMTPLPLRTRLWPTKTNSVTLF